MDDYQIVETLTEIHYIALKRGLDSHNYFLLTLTPLPVPISEEIRKRIDVLLFLKERRIIHMYDAFYIHQQADKESHTYRSHFVIVEELAGFVSLRHHLFSVEEAPLSNSFIRFVLRGTMKCLIHLHALQYSYGLLSPLQILVPKDRGNNGSSSKSAIRLRPFSILPSFPRPDYSSREKVLDPFTFQVSPNGEFSMMEFNERPIWYSPPEDVIQLFSKKNTLSSQRDDHEEIMEPTIPGDIWMLGCVMAELLLPFPIFSAGMLKDQVRNTIQLLGPPSNHHSVPNEILKSSLQKESSKVEFSSSVEPSEKKKRDFRITNLVKLFQVARRDQYDYNFSAIQILVWLMEYSGDRRPDISILLELPIFSERYNIPFYKIKQTKKSISPTPLEKKKRISKPLLRISDDEVEKEGRKFVRKMREKRRTPKKPRTSSPVLDQRIRELNQSLTDLASSVGNGVGNEFFSPEGTEEEVEEEEIDSSRKSEGEGSNKSEIRHQIERKLNILEKESLLLVSMLNNSRTVDHDLFGDEKKNKKRKKKKKNNNSPPIRKRKVRKKVKKNKKNKKGDGKKDLVFSKNDVDRLLKIQRQEFEKSMKQFHTEIAKIKDNKTILRERREDSKKMKMKMKLEDDDPLLEFDEEEEEEEVGEEIEEEVKTVVVMGDDETETKSYMSNASPPIPRRNTPTPSSKRFERKNFDILHTPSLYTPTEKMDTSTPKTKIRGGGDRVLFEVKVQVLGGLKKTSENRKKKRKKSKKEMKKDIVVTYSWKGKTGGGGRKMTLVEKKMKCNFLRGSEKSSGFLVWTAKIVTRKNEDLFRFPIALNVWEKNNEQKRRRKMVEEESHENSRSRVSLEGSKFLGRCEVDIFLLSLYDEKFKFSGWYDVKRNGVGVGKMKVVCGIRKSSSEERFQKELIHGATTGVGVGVGVEYTPEENEMEEEIEGEEEEEEEDIILENRRRTEENGIQFVEEEKDGEIIASLRNLRKKLREFQMN